jgi:chromosome segregation ATPase
MFTNNKKKLDLAEAAKLAAEKEQEKEKKEHEAAKLEIERLKAENESFRTQLTKAVEVAGAAMNGRWYADNGRYCGEIKMPQLVQATGTILNLKVLDENGVTKGVFLPPDSTGKFLGTSIEWDNSPDETGCKVWERKDDPSSNSGPNWAQIRIEEMRKERDAALAELANTTQTLKDHQKIYEATKADLEALRNDLNIDPSKVDAVGENRSMKVELVQVKGDLEVNKKDLDAARRVADGLREVIEGQKGEVEHARKQRTTWEQDRSELNALRASQQLAEAEATSSRKELEECKKELDEAKAKAAEMTTKHTVLSGEVAFAKHQLQEESKAHEELKVRFAGVLPENEACRAEADKQKRKATFSVQAHEFARQAHETLRAEHEKLSAELGTVRAEQGKAKEELQKYRQENEVLKVKSESVEAHLKAITIEHDERKKVALDLVEKLEDMKIKHSLLEKDSMEKTAELDVKRKALENIQSSLKSEFSSARQVFDTPYSDYLRSTKGHNSMGFSQPTDVSILPGAVHQPELINQIYQPSVTQIVIGRVGQVVVEN